MTEHLYRTPEGFVDVPFFYVYDGRGLTDGTSPTDLVVRVQEDPFILRSVAGVQTVAGRWMMYNASRSAVFSLPAVTYPRWTQVPERYYPAQSDIRFDLGTVARATNADGNFVSYIGFQGVKRLPRGQFGWTEYETPYAYWERPYQYQLDFTLDFFADAGAAPRQFNVEISDGDFELQAMSFARVQTTVADFPADPFRVTLYDPSGYNALSTEPCSPRWLNWLQRNEWRSAFPTPTLVYPVQSRIRLDIDSLTDTVGPAPQYQIILQGVERVPCYGG